MFWSSACEVNPFKRQNSWSVQISSTFSTDRYIKLKDPLLKNSTIWGGKIDDKLRQFFFTWIIELHSIYNVHDTLFTEKYLNLFHTITIIIMII
jgi:hypothetical protein